MLASPGGPDRFDITGEAARERVGVEVAVTGGSEDATGSIRRRRGGSIRRMPAGGLGFSAASGLSGSDTPCRRLFGRSGTLSLSREFEQGV